MSKILNGRKLAQINKTIITNKVSKLTTRKPQLVVLIIGNHIPSTIYVRNKIKACQDCGIIGKIIAFDSHVSQEEVINHIKRLNADSSVDGILVQLPLPAHLNTFTIINSIDINKDVDGLTNVNAGRLLQGDPKAIIPCTVKGILALLTHYKIPIKGQNVTIINDSNIVGKPLALLLTNLGATVSIAHKLTADLSIYTANANIICTATGVHNIINANQVKIGVTIIDIAINYQGANKKIVGDVDFTSMSNKTSAITPVPGGVGPMTIAMLLVNLMICYELNNKS